jgi:hypothetical protein
MPLRWHCAEFKGSGECPFLWHCLQFREHISEHFLLCGPFLSWDHKHTQESFWIWICLGDNSRICNPVGSMVGCRAMVFSLATIEQCVKCVQLQLWFSLLQPESNVGNVCKRYLILWPSRYVQCSQYFFHVNYWSKPNCLQIPSSLDCSTLVQTCIS